MAEERVERRLTAILAADVAGYSRLMGADEEGTLAALKVLRREVTDPKIKEHRGRIAGSRSATAANFTEKTRTIFARRELKRLKLP